MRYRISLSITLFMGVLSAFSQEEKVELLPYGNMNHWMVREIKESFVIGGNTQFLYAITDEKDTLKNNKTYKNRKSPWASSSVYAVVNGVKKGSVSVFPEKRAGHGFAARLETKVEHVKVLGIIKINVLASGTIFLGEMVEPIKDTKNPQSKLVTGIPFSKKPDFLQFDYKVITGGQKHRINGLSKTGDKLPENDQAEVHILLQKRWEDKNGNVYAKRIGTGWERYNKSVKKWQNQHRLKVHYGDISIEGFYKDYMGLKDKKDDMFYTRNSQDKMVPIHEQEWGEPGEEATHLIIQFSSSNGGAYIGNPQSKFFIDNVSLVYKQEASTKNSSAHWKD